MHYQENVATLPLSAVRRTLGPLPVTSVVERVVRWYCVSIAADSGSRDHAPVTMAN